MTGDNSTARKQVLLTSELQPDFHPLATILHDANNRLQSIIFAVDERRNEFEDDESIFLPAIVDQARERVGSLLRQAKAGVVNMDFFQENLTLLRGCLKRTLPHVQACEIKRRCVSSDAFERALDEFDMLMERGLEFIQNQPPEDRHVPGNIAAHVSDIVSHFKERYPHIHFDVSGETDCEILFHPPSIKRALENLLINAVQSLPERGGKILVRLEGRSYDATDRPFAEIKEGPYIGIEINDNGSGIPEEVLEKLSHSSITTKPDGSGLGLVSARKSMVRHRGHLIVESEQGCGAKVTALLPSTFPPPARVPKIP